MGLPEYTWKDSIPNELDTKTGWKKRKRKVLNVDNPVAIKLYRKPFSGVDATFLYHISNTIPVKRTKRKPLNCPDCTVENLAEALYVINKSAKISRDTKGWNYLNGNHELVKREKKRQLELYGLKDAALAKLVGIGCAIILGVHIQTLRDYFWDWEEEEGWTEERKIFLLTYKVGDYTFHQPITEEKSKNYKILGEIDGTISSNRKKTKLGFNESLILLKSFVNGEVTLVEAAEALGEEYVEEIEL